MGIEPLHREKITCNNNALEEVKISWGTSGGQGIF